jgi:hypothetical protein
MVASTRLVTIRIRLNFFNQFQHFLGSEEMSRKSTMTTENDDVVLFTAGTERGLITSGAGG